MAKAKKRRNKKYQGADAADAPVVVHRYKAVERKGVNAFWHEHKVTILVRVVQLALVLLAALFLLLLALLIW